ncbi:MAG: hypothetical protein BIFFINMI_01481 [Phycisphaerae bacterium]|nr:hypothetical protein [Phycisphaerae bacterium]
MKRFVIAILLLAPAAAAAADGPGPKFAAPPTAAKAGDGATVAFAVDRAADVAVWVLDAKGGVVRHLVAGVLGPNAPAPLKADSLAQTLAWDGKDDAGKPAEGGPFSFRVAAGLTPHHAGYPLEKPGESYLDQGIVLGIAARPDGGVYTINHRSIIRQKGYYDIKRYTHDGDYAGTLMPLDSQVDPKNARGVSPLVDATGRPMMVYGSANFALLDYMPANPFMQTPAVRRNGNLLLFSIDAFSWERGATVGLTELLPGGGTPETPYVRVKFKLKGGEKFGNGGTPALVLGDDEKFAYVVGLQHYLGARQMPTFHAVFRVALDGDGTLEPVFGDPAAAGGDDKHLSDPSAIAADGKGRLLIADRGNNRVVVLSAKDASWVGSFPVDGVLWVGASARSGAIYVCSHTTPAAAPDAPAKRRSAAAADPAGEALTRYSPWPDPKAQQQVALANSSRFYKGGQYVAAVDDSADHPRIWLGQNFNSEAMKSPVPELLAFCDDLGDSFSPMRPVQGRPGGSMGWEAFSDPTHRYVTVDGMLIDDQEQRITRPAKTNGTCQMGPDGLFYLMSNAGNIRRYTAKGEEVPFKAIKPGAWVVGREKDGKPVILRELEKGARLMGGVSYKVNEWSVTGQALPNYPSGTTGNERDFTLDREGNIYVKNRACQYHGPMTVDVYDKDGAYLRTAIWEIGDRSYGPRLDAAGNLYFLAGVTGEKGNAPDVFKSVALYQRLFGSIVKFSPRGGALHLMPDDAYEKNFGFPMPKLDLPAQTVSVAAGRGIEHGRKLEGALWWRPGFSVYNAAECHCNGHSFDVDPFGRVYYPDMLSFQIGVLDTNGNTILRLGGYGNRDQRGSYSWVPDAATGALRPPSADQIEASPSPFAQPEFAFAFLNSVAVTERHLFATDTLNQRVTRISLDYAVDQTCQIK